MSRSVVPSHAMRNILRYEHNGATSWLVCLKRRGRRYVQYLADGDAGPDASLRSAIAWRDEMEKRLTPWNKLHHRSASQTGIAGVTVANGRSRTGTPTRYWIASWPKPEGGRGRHKRVF